MLRIVRFSIILFALFFTIYIFSTSFFTRPMADDFCTGATLNQRGFWDSLVFSWNAWSGRYSYNFAIYFFMIFGSYITKIVPIIVLVGLIVSTSKVVGKLIPAKNKLLALNLSVGFVVVVLANTQNIIQSFYWYGGTLIYTLAFVFFNTLLYLLTEVHEKLPSQKKYYLLLASFITSVIGGGFSESFVTVQIGMLVVLFYINLLIEDKNKSVRSQLIISGLIGSLISLLLMYFAPGNVARSLTVSKPESIWWVISTTYDSTKVFLLDLIKSKVFWYSSTFVFTGFWLLFQSNISSLKNIINRSKIIYILILALLLPVFSTAIVFGISYYSMAYHPPERAMIIPIYIIFSCIVAASSILTSVLTSYTKKKNLSYFNSFIFVVFLISIVLLSRDTYRRWSFIRNDMLTYAGEWDNSEKIILTQQNSGKDIYIKYTSPIGRIDGFRDNKGWVLSCLAGYYNVKSVKISE